MLRTQPAMLPLIDVLAIPQVSAHFEPRRRKDHTHDRFRLSQGPDMKYRFTFQCELCPCRKTHTRHEPLKSVRIDHMTRHHGGAGLMPKVRTNDQWFNRRGKAEDFHWRCPLCKIGVSETIRAEISRRNLSQLKLLHKTQHHPELTQRNGSATLSVNRPMMLPRDVREPLSLPTATSRHTSCHT